MSTVHTYCRNCPSSCGMVMEVEDNKIIAMKGDRENPLSKGYFCVKGKNAVAFHNGAEERLTNSLKRHANDEFAAIDVEIAMDEIAAKLSELITQYGPNCVAIYHGSGVAMSNFTLPLAKSLLAEIGTPKRFSNMTVDQSSKWIVVERMGAFISGKPYIQELDAMLISGSNPIVSHQGNPFAPLSCTNPAKELADARQRGMKLIVIDPRKTETAARADLFIQTKPGEDAAIFAGLINIVLSNGWEDSEFCKRFITQLDSLRLAIAPFTPEYVANRAGISANDLEVAARILSTAKRCTATAGTGTDMAKHANLSEHLCEALNAVLGGYRREGDVHPNPGVVQARPALETVAPPTRSWERSPQCRTEKFGSIFGEFPATLMAQEILEPGKGKIRALLVLGGNPIMAIGDPAKGAKALKDLDLLVAVDPRITETSRYADYVIAPSLAFEREDVTLSLDGWFTKPFMQYSPAVIEPPADTIHDWDFLCGLANRLEKTLTYKVSGFGTDYNDIPGGLPIPEGKVDVDAVYHWIFKQGPSLIALDELKAQPHGIMIEAATQVVQAVPDNGVRLEVCPADIEQDISVLLSEDNNKDRQYAYQLISRRIVETLNTSFRDSYWSRKRNPVNYAYMNPEDMQQEGLRDGEWIEIASAYGSISGAVTYRSGWITPRCDFNDSLLGCRRTCKRPRLSVGFAQWQVGFY